MGCTTEHRGRRPNVFVSDTGHCMGDFRKGNYQEIRKSLPFIDGNDKMKNKTATE